MNTTVTEFDLHSSLTYCKPNRDLARMAIEFLDSLPQPRYIDPDEDIKLVHEGIGIFTVEGLVAAFNVPSNYPDGISLADATIHSLQANGERVGFFRSRKIKKLLGHTSIF